MVALLLENRVFAFSAHRGGRLRQPLFTAKRDSVSEVKTPVFLLFGATCGFWWGGAGGGEASLREPHQS